jgi:hypothetical protein
VSGSPTLCFFAAPPGGGGVVVEVSPPDGEGRIAYREWDSGAEGETTRHGHTTAADLERRIRGWSRAGWTLGETPERVLGWLKAHVRGR